jgi:hypothetical protein
MAGRSGTDFDFGFNVAEAPLPDPTEAEPERWDAFPGSRRRETLDSVSVLDCPHFGHTVDAWQTDAFEKLLLLRLNQMREDIMNLAGERSTNKERSSFEKRDWLDPQKDLKAKGSTKWKIDDVREAKKNKTKILAFMDLSNGSKKRVMSLRKGFTLDALIDNLGANTDKWKGKSIDLERGGAEGQYINVAQ